MRWNQIFAQRRGQTHSPLSHPQFRRCCRVKVYICGPTVYDSSHMVRLAPRSFIFCNTLSRVTRELTCPSICCAGSWRTTLATTFLWYLPRGWHVFHYIFHFHVFTSCAGDEHNRRGRQDHPESATQPPSGQVLRFSPSALRRSR